MGRSPLYPYLIIVQSSCNNQERSPLLGFECLLYVHLHFATVSEDVNTTWLHGQTSGRGEIEEAQGNVMGKRRGRFPFSSFLKSYPSPQPGKKYIQPIWLVYPDDSYDNTNNGQESLHRHVSGIVTILIVISMRLLVTFYRGRNSSSEMFGNLLKITQWARVCSESGVWWSLGSKFLDSQRTYQGHLPKCFLGNDLQVTCHSSYLHISKQVRVLP